MSLAHIVAFIAPMMVLNLGIGLYTPPVGTTLFISSTVAGGNDAGALAVFSSWRSPCCSRSATSRR